jgi:hypothetical protein
MSAPGRTALIGWGRPWPNFQIRQETGHFLFISNENLILDEFYFLVRSGRTAPENIKVKVGNFLFFVSNFLFRLEI